MDTRDNLLSTPLMEAAKRGQRAIISLLLENGANINAQDKKGATPLVYALLPDHTEVVTLLLGKGAKTIADNDNDTPAKLLSQKQLTLALSTLFSICLFIYGQRRPTKDKDLRKIEIIEMAAKLLGVFLIHHKYNGMKQLLKGTESSSAHDN